MKHCGRPDNIVVGQKFRGCPIYAVVGQVARNVEVHRVFGAPTLQDAWLSTRGASYGRPKISWERVEIRGGLRLVHVVVHASLNVVAHIIGAWTNTSALRGRASQTRCGRPYHSCVDVHKLRGHVLGGGRAFHDRVWAPRSPGRGRSKMGASTIAQVTWASGQTHFVASNAHKTFHAPASPRAPSFSEKSCEKIL